VNKLHVKLILNDNVKPHDTTSVVDRNRFHHPYTDGGPVRAHHVLGTEPEISIGQPVKNPILKPIVTRNGKASILSRLSWSSGEKHS
jgi:hypothetical protein